MLRLSKSTFPILADTRGVSQQLGSQVCRSVLGRPLYREHTQAVPSSTKSVHTFNPKDLQTWHKPRIPLFECWSCDWPHWDNAREFHDGYMSTASMREIYGVVGEVEPLAFVPEAVNPESTFVFVAGGVYYWYTYGALRRFEGTFAGHDDFFAAPWGQGSMGGWNSSVAPV
ncbi:hypothetical protein FB451DRAFT_1403788 [Mycena latifolia]|nr:hypothetical protein FB451DRAFT_1403788 [Mycena latifolia]